MIRNVTILVLLSFFVILVIIYNDKNETDEIKYVTIKNHSVLKSGDIIFRKEDSMISDIFSSYDMSAYSHVGILIKESQVWYVYHMEVDEDKDDFKIESLESFLTRAQSVGIYRFILPLKPKRIKAMLNKLYAQRLMFDYKFSLENETFYCTEFVNHVFHKLFNVNLYEYLYKFEEQEFISVRSLLVSQYLKKVLSYSILEQE